MNSTPCPFFINGEWIQSSLTGTPVHNPSTGEVIAQCPAGGASEVGAAVEAAAAAFPGWWETPAVERVRVLFKFKVLLEEHFEELIRLNTREHGKTLAESRGDVKRGIEMIEFACGIPSLLMGESLENLTGALTATPCGSRSGCAPASRLLIFPPWCLFGCIRWRWLAATPLS